MQAFLSFAGRIDDRAGQQVRARRRHRGRARADDLLRAVQHDDRREPPGRADLLARSPVQRRDREARRDVRRRRPDDDLRRRRRQERELRRHRAAAHGGDAALDAQVRRSGRDDLARRHHQAVLAGEPLRRSEVGLRSRLGADDRRHHLPAAALEHSRLPAPVPHRGRRRREHHVLLPRPQRQDDQARDPLRAGVHQRQSDGPHQRAPAGGQGRRARRGVLPVRTGAVPAPQRDDRPGRGHQRGPEDHRLSAQGRRAGRSLDRAGRCRPTSRRTSIAGDQGAVAEEAARGEARPIA